MAHKCNCKLQTLVPPFLFLRSSASTAMMHTSYVMPRHRSKASLLPRRHSPAKAFEDSLMHSLWTVVDISCMILISGFCKLPGFPNTSAQGAERRIHIFCHRCHQGVTNNPNRPLAKNPNPESTLTPTCNLSECLNILLWLQVCCAATGIILPNIISILQHTGNTEESVNSCVFTFFPYLAASQRVDSFCQTSE